MLRLVNEQQLCLSVDCDKLIIFHLCTNHMPRIIIIHTDILINKIFILNMPVIYYPSMPLTFKDVMRRSSAAENLQNFTKGMLDFLNGLSKDTG